MSELAKWQSVARLQQRHDSQHTRGAVGRGPASCYVVCLTVCVAMAQGLRQDARCGWVGGSAEDDRPPAQYPWPTVRQTLKWKAEAETDQKRPSAHVIFCTSVFPSVPLSCMQSGARLHGTGGVRMFGAVSMYYSLSAPTSSALSLRPVPTQQGHAENAQLLPPRFRESHAIQLRVFSKSSLMTFSELGYPMNDLWRS